MKRKLTNHTQSHPGYTCSSRNSEAPRPQSDFKGLDPAYDTLLVTYLSNNLYHGSFSIYFQLRLSRRWQHVE